MAQTEQSSNQSNKRDSKNNDDSQAGWWWIIIAALILLGIVTFIGFTVVNHKDRVNFLTVNALSVLVFAAIAMQVYIYRKQWKIMQEQKRMAAISERAYLGLRDFRINEIKNQVLVVSAVVVNGGRTPAWSFQSKTQVYLRYEPVPFVWEASADADAVAFIAAGGDRNLDFVPYPGVTQEMLDDLNSGRVTLFVDGECRYLDFTGERQVFVFGYAFKFGDGRARAMERYQRHYTQMQKPN